MGVRSLRGMLVQSQCSTMEVRIEDMSIQAFGQHEALISRLKHILDMYADGPGIFYELIQNADDAGASELAIMWDKRNYGKSSLLKPDMDVWQGQALYLYNNAVFKEKDFLNIASIGQGSKLDNLLSTGRFSLGFNSVYHWTDVPSFVSGDHVVIFDPHTCYLPYSNPGLKIKFTASSVVNQFPDQFAPYRHFGCDLSRRYPGTLFRSGLVARSCASCYFFGGKTLEN